MLEQVYMVVEVIEDEFFPQEVIGVFASQEDAQHEVDALCEQYGEFLEDYDGEQMEHFFVRPMQMGVVSREF